MKGSEIAAVVASIVAVLSLIFNYINYSKKEEGKDATWKTTIEKKGYIRISQ